MYQPGQFILYGKTGVCRVEDISPRPVGRGIARPYYALRPLYQNGVIFAPVENVNSGKIPTRPIMSREEAQRFIEELADLQAEPYYTQNIGQLREHYRGQLGSLSGKDLARLICSIYQKKQEIMAVNKRLGTVDQQFMDEAENLLYGELATALGIERDHVKGYIHDTLHKEECGQ